MLVNVSGLLPWMNELMSAWLCCRNILSGPVNVITDIFVAKKNWSAIHLIDSLQSPFSFEKY